MELLYKFTYNNTYERTARLSGTPVIHVDKSKWTAWFTLAAAADANLLQKGDFILTAGLPYQDQFSWVPALTYPVGFILSVSHDTIRLRNLAYGIREGMQLPLWMDYYVNEKSPLTGDIAAGSNRMTRVQGIFPDVGERLDIPMLPSGSYITAIDHLAWTISFSNPNSSGRSYQDHTFANGYPLIEMHSSYNLADLQQHGKTLIGGAVFYQYDSMGKGLPDPAYLLGNDFSARYKNFNTHFKGDTSLHKLRFTNLSGQ
jgi:hypothetical protein